jgi:hypothetical protein
MSTHAEASPNPRQKRARTVLLFIGALVFLFEEWLWTGFLHLFAWLGRFGLLRWVDARLLRLSPATALIILCIPIVFLFPVKVAGLWMIAKGSFFTGCLVMLAAKIASTALIARIFLTCRPQLLQMQWFARLYALTCAFRDRIHRWMAQQPAWHDAKRLVRHIRNTVRAWTRGHRASAVHADGSLRRGPLRRWRSRRRAAVAANLARSGSVDGKGR